MKTRSLTLRLMSMMVAVSFVYAPLSGVIPGWLGFDSGPYHVHYDHVFQGAGDHHHSHGDEHYQPILTADSQIHDERFESDTEQNGQHSHGPHMHFIDVMHSAFTLSLPSSSHELARISRSQQPEYLFPAPLFRPPQTIA
ncbi:MAG: hypothetical protein RIC29_00660 [Rhodospirillaceae bacterium]|jgi:hypothetical protein